MKNLSKTATEILYARGHPNISAKHKTTLEITTKKELTPKGDCIIAVGSNKGLNQLSGSFKKLAKKVDSTITMIIRIDNQTEIIRGRGDPHLTFNHPHDLVVRKSSYSSDRTLMIKADKAAIDLNRELVEMLKFPEREIEIVLTVETP